MGTNETVGRRVRVNLTLRGLSTLELAEFLGITRNAANRRLSGLDIPISDLFEPLPEQPVLIESVA